MDWPTRLVDAKPSSSKDAAQTEAPTSDVVARPLALKPTAGTRAAVELPEAENASEGLKAAVALVEAAK